MKKLVSVAALMGFMMACGGGDKPAPKADDKVAEPVKTEEAAEMEEPAKTEEAPAAAEAPAGDADFDAKSDEDKKKTLMELGEKVYLSGGSGGVACSTCHQANGEGLPPSFPPLKGQGEFMGDCKTHAGYVINGLQGEIEVGGVKYNGVMPAQANLSDLEIAAVITYERMSWGNDFGMCSPADVAAAR